MIDHLPRIDAETYVIAQLFLAAFLTFGIIGLSYWQTRRDMARTRAKRDKSKTDGATP